jgi:(p)ppGpp synthase/HD superfamily hydrolase
MKNLHRAINFASTMHEKQFDKQGRPYILHVLRVMTNVSLETDDADIVVAAALHDIVEDTSITITMIDDVFGPHVANIVDHLTRMQDEDYVDYIKRVSELRSATLIKIADLRDNMARIPGHMPGDKWDNLYNKYRDAVTFLEGSINE